MRIKSLMPRDGWIVGKLQQTNNDYFSDGMFMAVGPPPGGQVQHRNPLAINVERHLLNLRPTISLGEQIDPDYSKRKLVWFDDGEPFNARFISTLEKHFGSTDWYTGSDPKERVLILDSKPVAIVMGLHTTGKAPRSIAKKFKKRGRK